MHREDIKVTTGFLAALVKQPVSEKLLFSFRSLEARHVERRAGEGPASASVPLPASPVEPRAARSNGVMFVDLSSQKPQEKRARSALKVTAKPENIGREAQLVLNHNSRYLPDDLVGNSVNNKIQVSAFLSKRRKLGGYSTLQPRWGTRSGTFLLCRVGWQGKAVSVEIQILHG